MLKALNKDDLYKKTGWFSMDCKTIVDKLEKFGLVIIDKKELDILIKEEDDLK